MSIERERQLAACNCQLVLDLNQERRRTTIAERAIQLLVTVAGEREDVSKIVEAWQESAPA